MKVKKTITINGGQKRPKENRNSSSSVTQQPQGTPEKEGKRYHKRKETSISNQMMITKDNSLKLLWRRIWTLTTTRGMGGKKS